MAKFSFSLFLVAVLLGGTAADLMCILKELSLVTPDLFLSNPTRACQNVEEKFRRTQQELKKCLDFEIDTSDLKSLHLEFCNTNSEFRKKFDRQRQCLNVNMAKAMECLDNSPNIDTDDILRKSIYDICHSVSLDMSKCLGEKVGGSCGQEGIEVYGRMAGSAAPFFTGTCYSVARLGIDEHEFVEDVEEAERKAVKSSMAESEWDQQYAAATMVHSSLTWWILMGLSLMVVSW